MAHRRSLTTTPAMPCLLALAALTPLPTALEAQSAADFLEEARQAYEARMEGIESYEVTTNMAGMESTTLHVRREVDGMVLFLPEGTGVEEMGGDQSELDPAFFYRPEVAQRMSLEGEDAVEGVSCNVVVLDDFEGLDLAPAMGAAGEQGGFEPQTMRMCVDPGEYLIRKVEMAGLMTGMQEASEITTTMVFSDYREVDGVVHPFRVEITTAGIGEAMGGEQAEAAAALEELRRQLEALPESQRQAMEGMMEDRMEAMGAMMGVAGGEPLVVETTALEVNRGG